MIPPILRGDLPSILLWASLAAWMVPEIVRGARARGASARNDSAAQADQDRGSGRLIMASLAVSVVAAIAVARFVGGAEIARTTGPLLPLGIALMLFGVAFRWYSIRTLGRYFSLAVSVRQDHRVVRSGPYRLIRHPSYSGTLLTMLGFGLALDNALSLVVLLACGSLMYAYRVSVEEHALVAKLGREYLDYMRETKRFIPWLL